MAVGLANQKLIPPGKIADTALSFIFVAEMDSAAVERHGLLKFVRDHLDNMYDHSQRTDLVEQLRAMLDTFECL
jgi:DNA-binding PucR family transcriptional regulator